jgi:hypothetical protein
MILHDDQRTGFIARQLRGERIQGGPGGLGERLVSRGDGAILHVSLR